MTRAIVTGTFIELVDDLSKVMKEIREDVKQAFSDLAVDIFCLQDHLVPVLALLNN